MDAIEPAFAVWSAVVALLGAAIVWELSRLRGAMHEIQEQLNEYMLTMERRVTTLEERANHGRHS